MIKIKISIKMQPNQKKSLPNDMDQYAKEIKLFELLKEVLMVLEIAKLYVYFANYQFLS